MCSVMAANGAIVSVGPDIAYFEQLSPGVVRDSGRQWQRLFKLKIWLTH